MIKTKLIKDINDQDIDNALFLLTNRAKLNDATMEFIDIKYSTCHIGNSTVIHSALIIYKEMPIMPIKQIPIVESQITTD